jgi:predicted nucleotidyltransferase
LSVPSALLDEHPPMAEWSILLAYRGSIAHGMYEPNDMPTSTDDKDLIGVCVPPLDHYVGFREFGNQRTYEVMSDPWDIVVYEATKAIKMLADGNPNVLSFLWLPEDLYLSVSSAGRRLIDSRDIFAARSTYFRFIGYAREQMRKMESGAYLGYMGEKRKRLVEAFGYDTKNASHLIRILRMGIEFLDDGTMRVQRQDAAELMAIKHGGWPLEKVKAEAERLFELAAESHVRSPLPDEPDRARVNSLAVQVVLEALTERAELPKT